MTYERRPIPGWEHRYSADTDGVIWSTALGEPRPLKARTNRRRETWYVTLSDYSAPTKVPVARLVLSAFIGPAEGRWALHLDGDPANNRLSNLRWATPAEAGAHMRQRRRHLEEAPIAQGAEQTRGSLSPIFALASSSDGLERAVSRPSRI